MTELATHDPKSETLYLDPALREDRPAAVHPDSAAWRGYWNRQIARSQFYIGLVIDGISYVRLPYDKRRNEVCHDCGCTGTQLHVPGCDMETCPACHGQLISCGCTPVLGNGDGASL